MGDVSFWVFLCLYDNPLLKSSFSVLIQKLIS